MYGKPAPQGSKRFVGVTKTGKGLMRESSDALTPWRNAVVSASLEELKRYTVNGVVPEPMDHAIQATFWFTFLRPASAKRSKRPYPSIAPDLSKLVRSTEDGLKDAGIIRDDALIVQTVSRKDYAGEGPGLQVAGCVILLQPVVPWECPPGVGMLELDSKPYEIEGEA